MSISRKLSLLVIFCALPGLLAAEEGKHPTQEKLTLAGAESIALRSAPLISEAYFKAEASGQVIREARSQLFPQITAIASAVGTGNDISNLFGADNPEIPVTRIGATGGFSNPAVYSRESNGVMMSQLITDFGRTSNLVSSARYQAMSQSEKAGLVRAQVILLVDETYFKILGAQALLTVADETVAARQLIVDQVAALTKSKLKSELDLSFAKVDLENAKLLVLQTQNALDGAEAELSAALGYREMHHFSLADESQYPTTDIDIQPLITQGLKYRPDLVALRDELQGAVKFTAAEREARFPIISAMGTIGRTPLGESAVQGNYSAGGINVELPIFTGGLLDARYQEAMLKAKAAEKAVQEAEDQVVKEVNEAWLDSATALKKIQVSKELLANASQALELAQSRYKLGLNSIIELSQAQLNNTQAEISYASSKYEYQIDRVKLDFDTGALKFCTPSKSGR